MPADRRRPHTTTASGSSETTVSTTASVGSMAQSLLGRQRPKDVLDPVEALLHALEPRRPACGVAERELDRQRRDPAGFAQVLGLDRVTVRASFEQPRLDGADRR